MSRKDGPDGMISRHLLLSYESLYDGFTVLDASSMMSSFSGGAGWKVAVEMVQIS